MRILHVISSLDPKFGGTTTAVRLLLEYGPREYAQEVATLDAPDADYLSGLGYPVHALGPVKSTYGRSSRLIPWLKANRARFDGVVLHGMWQFTGYAVWKTMRGHVPYVVFTHGMLDPYFKRAYPSKHWKKWLYWLPVEYWVLRDAKRVLFTCDAEARLAKESFWLHRWNPLVVALGTVSPGGDPDQQREAFLDVCPGARGRRLLLFLGRIDKKKGCDLLIEAFLKVAGREPGIDLVMAGPDPDHWRKELIRHADSTGFGKRIHWPGMLTGETKWGAFQAAEAFVLPSHQENFGIAIVEAMACSKPVLVSDKVNIAADITTDGAGLVEADTAEGTLRLLERWVALPAAEQQRMGVRALACFHRRYDMRENAKTIVRLFESNV